MKYFGVGTIAEPQVLRPRRALPALVLAALVLLIAGPSSETQDAIAATPPQAPPYVCDGSRDGQQVWSDGYVWECKNVGGFYRWVIVGGGAGRPYIKEKVQYTHSPNGSWTVYAPQDPGRAQALRMEYGDGYEETRTVNQGSGSQTFTFSHAYCGQICVNPGQKWSPYRVTASFGLHAFDIAVFWDYP